MMTELVGRALKAISLVILAILPVSVHAQSGLPTDVFKDLERIASAYKIDIVKADASFPVATTYGMIDGKNAGRKELQEYAALFAPEFALYPTDLIQRSRLKRVVLCRELSFAGQVRNAIPDFEHDTLYLDVVRGRENKTYLRKVIHHEFFHLIDYRDDGTVYKDERWESLNPPNFKYGRGGQTAQQLQQTSVLTDRFPGFLNHYSTTGVEEDKAEVFAGLLVDSVYVENRVKRDRVLKAKVERMREFLATFCPEMSDNFWRKIGKTQRSEK